MTWDPGEHLHATNAADRYVAVKATGFLDRQDLIDPLIEIAEDDDCERSAEVAIDAHRNSR